LNFAWQVTPGLEMQLAPWQTPTGQAPELAPQPEPSRGLCVHCPDLLHESWVQGLPSLQFLNALPTHLPETHLSLEVQALPSLQTLLLKLCLQLPLLHLPLVQGLPSPTQDPDELARCLQLFDLQMSVVQGLPSEVQALLLALWVQPPFWSQPSMVHGLPSSQSMPPVPLHLPLMHLSDLVQILPSSQNCPDWAV